MTHVPLNTETDSSQSSAGGAHSNRDEDLKLLRRNRRNTCEVEIPSNKTDSLDVNAAALKALKSKAQSSHNLLGSVSSDAVAGGQYRGGISKSSPRFHYSAPADEFRAEDVDSDLSIFSEHQQQQQQQQAPAMMTRSRSARNTMSSALEEKSSRSSMKALGSGSGIGSGGGGGGNGSGSGSLNSLSSDAVGRERGVVKVRSPIRPQTQLAFQPSREDEEYEVDERSHPHPHPHKLTQQQHQQQSQHVRYAPAPDEQFQNMRIHPQPLTSSPEQQPHPFKSLRRNPETAPTSPAHSLSVQDRSIQDWADNAEASAVEDMAIRVVVRKRPLSKSEIGRGEKDVMEVAPLAMQCALHYIANLEDAGSKRRHGAAARAED